MAHTPIQSLSGRAEPHAAALPAAIPSRPGVGSPRALHVHDSGGISGGILRPGAIDQELFKAHLAAAQKGDPSAPPLPRNAPAFAGIPTLSPAQLAALGVNVEPPPGELVIDIPAPNPAESGPGTAPQSQRARPGQAGGIQGGTGAPAAPLFRAAPAAPAADGAAPAAPIPDAAEAAPEVPPAPALPPTAAPTPAPEARLERGPIPGARRGADGAWELTRRPDKDEREMLRGQAWRVVESADSRRLFLGPDGAFGWDDFLDLINPLQHIPLVNMAYRAITGDEIYGAARMVDVAFGPLAGVSTAVDLAFRDITGAGMADNAIAALFGPGDDKGGDMGSISTASSDRQRPADGLGIRRGSNK